MTKTNCRLARLFSFSVKNLVFFASLCAMILVSCANSGSLPRRMDNFVNQTEASADYMTEKDWKISAEQLDALIEEFIENYDSYTPEERKAFYKALGRYNGLLTKNGLEELCIEVDQVKNALNSFLDELPDALNGLLEGFKSGLE